MKNIIIILLLFFFNTNAVKATEYKNTEDFSSTNNVKEFNQWLYDNGHKQYLTIKENKKCETAEKGS